MHNRIKIIIIDLLFDFSRKKKTSNDSSASGGIDAAIPATNECLYTGVCNPFLIGSVLIASIQLLE